MGTWATSTDVTTFAVELASMTSTQLSVGLSIAQAQLDANTWQNDLFNAHLLLTCHVLTMLSRKGAGGLLTEEKAGDLQVSFANISKFPKSWDLTSYGQLFKQFMDSKMIYWNVTQAAIPPVTSDDLGIWGNFSGYAGGSYFGRSW